MSRTLLTSREIGNVQKNDFDIVTVGQSVITNIVAGTNVTISQTGADSGTGAVTVNATSPAIGSTLTGATTGSVLFVGASSGFAQNNSKLFWDNTNFRLGINTSAPSKSLHIIGENDNTANGPLLIQSEAGTNGTGLSLDATSSGGNKYAFGAGGSGFYNSGGFYIYQSNASIYRFHITSSGNVGIGSILSQMDIANSLLSVKGGTSIGAGYYSSYAAPTNGLIVEGNTGIGIVNPTAKLHLSAGTAAANTAPIKLTSGVALTTTEDGALEYHSSHLYFTIGLTRYQLDQQGGGGGIADGDKGDITVSGAGTNWTIDNTTISLAKIQNATASSRLLGSGSSGSGSSYSELSLGTNLSISGTTLNAVTADIAIQPNSAVNSSYPNSSYGFNATVATYGYPVDGRLAGTRNGVNNVQRLQGYNAGSTYSRYWIEGSTAWSAWTIYLDSEDFTAKGQTYFSTGSNSVTTLAAPSTGQFLTGDTSQATGVLWTNTLTAPIFSAGSATAGTKPKLASGTVLTIPESGALEFDGNVYYKTTDTTNGRMQDANYNLFRLTANGTALSAIGDYFGSNSAIPTVTNGVYRIIFYLYFSKATAGTATYTITNTQAYSVLNANYVQTPVGGIGTVGTAQTGAFTGSTAAAALPVTGSLTTGVNHQVTITCLAVCSTAGNIRLRITPSAGSITPLLGSYFTVERLASGNVGIFVA